MGKLPFGAVLTTLLCISLVFGMEISATTDSIEVEWNKTYEDGVVGQYVAIQTFDGGYAIVGPLKTSQHSSEIGLIRTDSNGNHQWSKTYGGTSRDYGYSGIQTSDEGFLIVGNIMSGWANMQLIKTDLSGSMQWEKSYTDTGTAFDFAQTADGGYILAGVKTGWDAWLMKIEADGVTQWSKTFAVANNSQLSSVVQTDDGGYMALGATQYPPYNGKVNAYLVRADSEGNLLWEKDYSLTAGNDYGADIIRTSDGGYALTGETDHFGKADFWLIRLNSAGDLLWDKTYGGSGWDGPLSILQTCDGGHLVVGRTNSFGAGGDDLWLVKTDANGDMEWDKTYGGAGNDAGTSVISTSDGRFALAGYTNSFSSDNSYEVWLIKFESTSIITQPTSLPTITPSPPQSPTFTPSTVPTVTPSQSTAAQAFLGGEYWVWFVILSCSLLCSVAALVAFLLRDRKKTKGIKKLTEMVQTRDRFEIKEASYVTGIKQGNIKKRLLEIMAKDSEIDGFFIKDGSEFIRVSYAASQVNSLGRFSFEEFASAIGIPTGETKEIVEKLLQQRKITGAFTADGKGFVTEARLMDEIRRD